MMDTKWYYVQNKDKVGPINEQQLHTLISQGNLGPENYVWKKGLSKWEKIKDLPELMKISELKNVSNEQGPDIIEEGQEDPQKVTREIQLTEEDGQVDQQSGQQEVSTETSSVEADENDQAEISDHNTTSENQSAFNWHTADYDETAYYIKQTIDGDIYGPYSLNIIKNLFNENRIDVRSYVFNVRIPNWILLSEIPIYEKLFFTSPPSLDVNNENKFLPPPLIAKIFSPQENTYYTGICRDVSIGGMQILVSNFPALKGQEIEVKIHPKNTEEYFVANGQVARSLTGNQGVFVRFKDLSDQAYSSINNYLNSNLE